VRHLMEAYECRRTASTEVRYSLFDHPNQATRRNGSVEPLFEAPQSAKPHLRSFLLR